MVVIGDVRSDVRFLQVSLSNGQIVTLKPVAIFGRSHAAWVAMMVPYPAAVTMITAYSTKGQVGYTIPFARGAMFSAIRWFAPGQAARPARATYKIASGKVDGKPWAEYTYVGPWGSCLTGAGVLTRCIAKGLDGVGRSVKPASLVIETADSPDAPKVAYYLLVAKPAGQLRDRARQERRADPGAGFLEGRRQVLRLRLGTAGCRNSLGRVLGRREGSRHRQAQVPPG